MEYIILAVGILFFGAFLSLLFKNDAKLKFVTLASFLSMLAGIYPAGYVLVTGNPLELFLKGNNLFGNVYLALDALSALFILIISVMSFIGIIYANGYLKPYIDKGKSIASHCVFLLLLVASMLSVVIVQHSFFFLIAWEIMSLASFFLVIFEGEKKEVLKSGIKYLIYMHLSILFIISMMVVLTNSAQSFNFFDFVKILRENQVLANLAFTLGFIGFGIKAGFVPFHNWLPDAHPAAPTHVSGIMSGVMIKTGIYGILRILSLVGIPTKMMAYLALTVAVITMLYGILYAITQHDIKRLLAYSSIENIGIITLGISVGMLGLVYQNSLVAVLGFLGGLLHVFNHSVFKELMFFAAGSIYLKTHTRNMELLGGLIKKMPKTGVLFVLGSVAICGLPPFNGFISEVLIYAGMLKGVPSSEINLFIILAVSIGALALVGTMAMLCFSKASGIIWLGEPRSNLVEEVSSDISSNMYIPMLFLAFLAFAIGVLPQVFTLWIIPSVSVMVQGIDLSEIFTAIITLMKSFSIVLLIFLVILFICITLRKIFLKEHSSFNTWGCGYDRPNSRMQYTPSSYVNLLVSTLKPLFKRVSHIKKPKDLFPKEAYYEQEIEDIEEAYIVEPLIKLDEKFLTKFERIQNGNIQQYILFGLVFLVISIIGLIYFG